MDNPVSAFDFALHYRLKGLCDSYGFSLTTLAQPGTVMQDQPLRAVTFVDNHDTIRDDGNAIVHDKLMAYSFILTHEGYPSVFWMDWYNFGLAQAGSAQRNRGPGRSSRAICGRRDAGAVHQRRRLHHAARG